MAAPVPTDMAAIPIPQSFPSCGSYSLYAKKDYAAARACAIQERAVLIARGPGSAEDALFQTGGEIVLAQLYANGEGVAQNGALAARFVCEAIDSEEVEMADPHASSEDIAKGTKDVLVTLNRLETLAPGSSHFEFCDDGQTPEETPTTRYCDGLRGEARAELHAKGIQEGIDQAQQDADAADAAIKPVLAKFTTAQRAAYSRLAAADRHFIDVQATGDLLYMGGYGSGGLYPDELHADFENRVVVFASTLPSAKPDEFAEADAALNKAYRDLIAAATPGGNFIGRELNAGNIRTEQYAWLAYRDAFAAFGKALAPELPAKAWILQLTHDRANALEQVYDIAGKELIQAGEQERRQRSEITASEQAQVTQERARVSQYFDNQTPAQAAAWKPVEAALSLLAAAHKDGVPNDIQDYGDQQLQALYGDLYCLQYNSQHGFAPDPAKAAADYAELDKRLDAAFQADMASDCLFTENRSGFITYRNLEALRAEQRAWLRLRDAWVDFLGTLFPALGKEERANGLVGGRVFELETTAKFCRPLN